MSTRCGRWLLLCAALAATTTACATAVPEVQRLQAQAAFERGLSHLRDKQPAPALTALQEAAALDPGVAVYRDMLGLVYLDLGRVDLAIEHFTKAVELDPKFADGHFHLGTAYAESKRWEDAVGSYRVALALPRLTVPDFAHQNLGLALYHLGRYREAEQALRFALSLDPNLQPAYYHLGLLFAAEGRKDEARAAFQHAVRLGTDSPFGQAARNRLRAMGDGS